MSKNTFSINYFGVFTVVCLFVGGLCSYSSPVRADLVDPYTEKLRAEYDSATCPQEMKECRFYVNDNAECEALSKDPNYYLLIQSPGATVHYEKYCKKPAGTISPSKTSQSPTPTKDINTSTIGQASYGTVLALSVPIIALVVLFIRRFRFKK